MENDNRERLVKFLSSAGAASRRAAGELVKSGRVAVNGRTVLEPGTRVAPGDQVTLDGAPVRPAEVRLYIMLHKPRGYVWLFSCLFIYRFLEWIAMGCQPRHGRNAEND